MAVTSWRGGAADRMVTKVEAAIEAAAATVATEAVADTAAAQEQHRCHGGSGCGCCGVRGGVRGGVNRGNGGSGNNKGSGATEGAAAMAMST